MVGFLARAGRFVARTSDELRGARSTTTPAFMADKVTSIASYAEFCREGTFPAYPLEIFLEISNICDLKCAMCTQFSALNPHRMDILKETPRGFMQQGEVSENLDKALKHAVLVHCFGYGEPTIHPTFKSFLDLISRYEVMIDFFTNGMHLDEEFCRFLVDKRIYQITVSFSGATKELYESIYIGGNFEKVLAGIKCLADHKKAQGSRYPIIEVNSLGFRDHVAQFDDFVSLMSDHGVNVIMLKPLESRTTIPQLYEHVSIMRPEQEGAVVRRALEIGRRRGVHVNADLYTVRAAVDDQDYEQRMASLKDDSVRHFGGNERAFGLNPVSSFSAIAADLQPIRNADRERRDPRVLGLDAPRPVAHSLLNVRPLHPEGSPEPPFHCMEPYKTLYVSRNGAAKPCCFANPYGWYLGDVKKDEALRVWQGEGFQLTREAIASGSYPMKTCQSCLSIRGGPQGHSAGQMLDTYLTWHRSNYSDSLRAAIEAHAPTVLEEISRAQPSDIMGRARNKLAAVAPESWTVEPAPIRVTEFVAADSCYLHRDLIADKAERRSTPAPDTAKRSSHLGRVLYVCGKRHYGGKGSIVALGLPSGSLLPLVAGLRANPRYDAILESFRKRRDKPVERFDEGGDKTAAFEDIVERRVDDLSKIRWLASKPIEICLAHDSEHGRLLQPVLRELLPSFIPGETILVLSDFYLPNAPQTKVLMGYLADAFEWLGQADSGAVFRLVKPVDTDLLAVNPLRSLPAALCLEFHRRWENTNVPRGLQLRLDVSYARLLAQKVDSDQALAHLGQLADRYRDLLEPPSRQADAFSKLLAGTRDRLMKQRPRPQASA